MKKSKKNKGKHRPIIHRMNRRAYWKDYSLPGLYMITVVTSNRRPLLGTLISAPVPFVQPSALGERIAEEIRKLPLQFPNTKILKICIMPDHVHFIIHVFKHFPHGMKLGSVIKELKINSSEALYEAIGTRTGTMFEKGYHDRIIREYELLPRWLHYMEDNPRRLAIKREHREYFTILHHFKILGRTCMTVGNQFLMDIPDKMAVIVHHDDSPEEFKKKKRMWLECGERGGVLVSAAVAPREKEVMREAMDQGYGIILLRENGFPPLYKPGGESFDACAEGRLLQIGPAEFQYSSRKITRRECLELNDFAMAISEGL